MPEGRGGTLENAMQSQHEPDSVPEKAASLTGDSSPLEDGCALVSNGLHRVREIAKRDKDVKFTWKFSIKSLPIGLPIPI